MRDLFIAYIHIYVCVCVLNDDVYGMVCMCVMIDDVYGMVCMCVMIDDVYGMYMCYDR